MGNNKHGREDVRSPVERCSYFAKGTLRAKVYIADRKDRLQEFAGAGVKVSDLPMEPLPKTNPKGEWVSPRIKAQSYTVSVHLTGEDASKYEFDAPYGVKTDEVKVFRETVYSFKLPPVWVDFEIKLVDGKPAQGLDYVIRCRKKKEDGSLEDNWTKVEEGKLPGRKIEKDLIPKGQYEIGIKALGNAVWSQSELVQGEEIELQSEAAAWDEGTDGKFEIYDQTNLLKPLHTVNGKVVHGDEGNVLKTKWIPKKEELEKSEQERIHSGFLWFRASIGDFQTFSAAIAALIRENLELADVKGKAVEGRVTLHYANGEAVETNCQDGKGVAKIPWGPALIRIGMAHARVAPDGKAGQGFVSA
jgi:hypothetical protein